MIQKIEIMDFNLEINEYVRNSDKLDLSGVYHDLSEFPNAPLFAVQHNNDFIPSFLVTPTIEEVIRYIEMWEDMGTSDYINIQVFEGNDYAEALMYLAEVRYVYLKEEGEESENIFKSTYLN